jgi:hypothetical protein
MKDQNDPDDIDAGPVPYDFPMQYSAEDDSNIAHDTESGFYESNTPSELDSELLVC